MTVAIDIGNSNIVVGVFADDEWKYTWRLNTVHDGNINALKVKLVKLMQEAGLLHNTVGTVVLGSVVPGLTKGFADFCADFFKRDVIVIDANLIERLDLKVLRPFEIGPDLVANAYAALKLFERNCLIVDFGTALTFTAADVEKGICGVSIAPGVQTAIRSLRSDTARLPEVPLAYPERVAGTNTVEAIQSGILFGYKGLIKHLLQAYRTELGPLHVVATGGLVTALPHLHSLFDTVHPTLTLDGLRLIADRLQPDA